MNRQKAQTLPITNSTLIDVHLVSDSPGIKNITDMMMEYFKTDDFTNKKISKIIGSVNLVLLNLYHNWRDNPERFTAYSRDNNKYLSENSRYNLLHINRKRLLLVIDTFAEKDLVYKRGGNYNRKINFGCQSRIIASNKLIKYFELYPIKQSEIIRHPDTETIWFRIKDRHGNKKNIEYNDNRLTRKMRQQLQAYNELLARSIIKIDDKIQPRQFVYRLFNNDFKHGGRFYGGIWQQIKSEQRKLITINDKPTAELDYSTLHLAILYHQIGIDYPPKDFDLYLFPGLESERELIKVCVVTALNSKSNESAIKAIRGKINKNEIETAVTSKDIPDIFELILQRNKAIEHHFFSGVGLKLQFEDSEIAANLLSYFTNRQILVLPVHDSFVIEESHVSELRKRMQLAYEDKFGFVPKIERKF